MCGATGRTVLYPFDIRDVVSCQTCDFVYAHPMAPPGHFDDIYSGEYWTSYNVEVGEPDIHDRVDEFLEISKERIERLTRFQQGGKLLDVGCSMGFLVKAASDIGFDAIGIDLSEQTLAEGREKFEVDLMRSTLNDLPTDQKYDVITCYNTIEHLRDPEGLLKDMVNRLSPLGIVVIGTHDIESGSHQRERRLWKHIMPTEHLYYFRRDDLVSLGERIGLSAIHADKPIDNSIVVYYKHTERNAE
jgi:SAM-dependent methyltransferase